MKSYKHYTLLIIFTLIISGLTLIDLLNSEKNFSDLENRVLSTRPTLSPKSFLSGDFALKYETYINDQFIFRNNWIDLKSKSEYILGKIENNGIIYGSDGYMFEKFDFFDESILTKNTDSIIQFASKYKLPTTFALIPSSYMILHDKLPLGSPVINQYPYIDSIYLFLKQHDITPLDLVPALSTAKDEYIYYRTDHHWTTYGAYIAYQAFASSLNLEATLLDALTPMHIPNFYGTYFSKAKLFNAKSDTLTYYPVDASITIDGKSYPGLYNLNTFESRDKYAAFLWGNHGITVITPNTLTVPKDSDSKLLVIKDSYSNCFVPFLTANYDEIHIIDLRSIPMKLSEYLENHDFDQVLIMYSFKNFVEDTNINKLKY